MSCCSATGVVLGSPTVNDNCGVATVTNNAPASFPIGTNYVTWTVKDNSGNTATCIQTVIVNDSQLPTLACPTLVITTEGSGLASVDETRAWQETIPDSELLVLPGDSFHVAATDAEQCAQATLAFIQRRAPTGGWA